MAVIKPRSYRRQVFQFVLVFTVLAAASSALETWMRARQIGVGYQDAITRTVRALTAPLGVDAGSMPAGQRCTLRVNNIQLVVTIECAAVLATGLFVSAVLAFPGGWRVKVVGVILGVVGVALLNVLRVVILATVAQHKPDWFNVTHDVLMQGFLVVMVTPLWLVWLAWVMRAGRRSSRSASAPAVRGD
ncbi:MAG: archaeosortase/exosortase family protein [Phycisphaerales bacterium]|nr:MAG: archaeosortase/exosortase family protein [Phycisphaerales bacterium]